MKNTTTFSFWVCINRLSPVNADISHEMGQGERRERKMPQSFSCVSSEAFGTIEETFAFEYQSSKANKCGFSEPTGLLVLDHLQNSKTAQIAVCDSN